MTEGRQPDPLHVIAPRLLLEDADRNDASALPPATDVISATVTLVHDGIGQLRLELNNQRLVALGGQNAGAAPTWPPWRYNDFQRIRFGQRLHVTMGYQELGLPLILARVTGIVFEFPQSGPARVVVEGKDLLSLLETKPREDRAYRGEMEEQIVRTALSESETGLTLAQHDTRPEFSGDNAFAQPLRTLTHAPGQSYLDFIQQIAKRLDYEVYADPVHPHVHFERARSRGNEDPFVLRWGRDLLSFMPEISVWEQYTSATVSGRRSRSSEALSVEPVGEDAVLDDLQHDGEADGFLSAIRVRQALGEDEQVPSENPLEVDATNLDDARARVRAEAELRAQARKFLTATAEVVGNADLRPGGFVRIEGFEPPFDGVYYLTRTEHAFGASGYRTRLSMRRPGWFNPARYASSQQAQAQPTGSER